MATAKQKRILFFYLSAFSQTGGIEKFNRCLMKALNELPSGEYESRVVSVYDNESDTRYNERLLFRGFNKKRGRSVAYIIYHALQYDVLVLGHINLAIAGVVVKLLRPACKLVVVAHGIETWKKLHFFKKWCLRKADVILSVSNYTRNQLVLRNNIQPWKIRIFPNTIDPLFKVPALFGKPAYLLQRYGLDSASKVILTLSRLSSSEKEKGYDKVIAALPAILKEIPGAVYLLAGRYDDMEKKRISALLKKYDVADKVILCGFVREAEVADHYQLADVFIMPSRKEGFGIVFLEAMACGTPVIGGNQDGTVDALCNGSLGVLINPTKTEEVSAAILSQLRNQQHQPQLVQQMVMEEFNFLRYKQRLQNAL